MRFPMMILCAATALMAHHASSACAQDAQQLARWLRQYPQADADGDGVLTLDEANAYRQKMLQDRAAGPVDFPAEYTFATMSDGVQIALAVGFPRGFDRGDTSRKWPAMLEMMGYPDSTIAKSPRSFNDRYVTVRASVRGAGASGGVIRAISPRTGQDGYEVIENWIVKQPWSNGKVALHGHSWGGLTGLMIAATNPPHLSAASVSGLFDDVYRDIGRIGGIRNSGFPVNWTINLYKPTGPFDSGLAAKRARSMSDQEYQAIVDARPPWDLTHSILWKSLTGQHYEDVYALASPGSYAAEIRVPIHIMHAYQDEQTGPSGVWLWSKIASDVPKRLVLSNGNHGDVGHFNRERMQWLDFWTLEDGQNDPAHFTDPQRRVQVYFETTETVNLPLVVEDFPLPNTRWVRYFLADQQRLAPEVPAGDSGGDSWRCTVGTGATGGWRTLLVGLCRANCYLWTDCRALLHHLHDARHRSVCDAGRCGLGGHRADAAARTAARIAPRFGRARFALCDDRWPADRGPPAPYASRQ